jgi:integrase
MFCFVAMTGARRSELLRSRIDDFNFRLRKVMIREKKRVAGKASTRSVDMHPMLDKVMKKWFADHPGGQYTLCHDDGSELNVDVMDHRFAFALRGCNWEVIRGFHTFRHSFASILASKGVDQRIINAFMGHQTPEQEARYRHLFPKTLRSAIEELLR